MDELQLVQLGPGFDSFSIWPCVGVAPELMVAVEISYELCWSRSIDILNSLKFNYLLIKVQTNAVSLLTLCIDFAALLLFASSVLQLLLECLQSLHKSTSAKLCGHLKQETAVLRAYRSPDSTSVH